MQRPALVVKRDSPEPPALLLFRVAKARQHHLGGQHHLLLLRLRLRLLLHRLLRAMRLLRRRQRAPCVAAGASLATRHAHTAPTDAAARQHAWRQATGSDVLRLHAGLQQAWLQVG
jgi:hypothetical protein